MEKSLGRYLGRHTSKSKDILSILVEYFRRNSCKADHYTHSLMLFYLFIINSNVAGLASALHGFSITILHEQRKMSASSENLDMKLRASLRRQYSQSYFILKSSPALFSSHFLINIFSF